MANNVLENNVVVRFLFGLIVIAAMFVVGGATAGGLLALGVPYGDWIGAPLGALVFFVVFAHLYVRAVETVDAA